jgi:hypothetical protein
VRTSIRIGLMGALSVSVMLAASGTASAKPRAVSTKKYAKTLCTAYLGLPKAFKTFTTAYNTAPTDPPTFQSTVVTNADDLISSIKSLEKKVKHAYPDVDGGKKITKLFVNDFQHYVDKVTSALSAFKSADPNGATFVADQAKFEAAMTVLSAANPNDPFRKVDDQDVLNAFGKEKACDQVVTIYGG